MVVRHAPFPQCAWEAQPAVYALAAALRALPASLAELYDGVRRRKRRGSERPHPGEGRGGARARLVEHAGDVEDEIRREEQREAEDLRAVEVAGYGEFEG